MREKTPGSIDRTNAGYVVEFLDGSREHHPPVASNPNPIDIVPLDRSKELTPPVGSKPMPVSGVRADGREEPDPPAASDPAKIDATSDGDIARRIAEDPDVGQEGTEEMRTRPKFAFCRLARPYAGRASFCVRKVSEKSLAASGSVWPISSKIALPQLRANPVPACCLVRSTPFRTTRSVKGPRGDWPPAARCAVPERQRQLSFKALFKLRDLLHSRRTARKMGPFREYQFAGVP
jgi:hypothetical protein